jgi:hypothetical protein
VPAGLVGDTVNAVRLPKVRMTNRGGFEI